jgi:alanine racemase
MVKHSSTIELSQKALTGNINFLKKQVGPNVQISCVIKANAYGHGIEHYLPMAEKAGINHFSVASSREAYKAKEAAKPTTRIMIMGILYDEDLPWVLKNNVEFYVFHYQRLEKVAVLAKQLGLKARVHLEVETGANRTGLAEKTFAQCLSVLQHNKEYLQFEGLCTHFGGAETFSNDFKIQRQYKRFKTYYKLCQTKKILPRYRHLASSAAALSFAASHFEMVRVGVAQYGFWPSPDVYYHHLVQSGKKSETGLRRLFTWKTDVMDVRAVPEGEFIGYGTAYQATRPMTIAVLPLGYSNGYPRGQSNNGHVLIHGKKAPICGLINMNLFMVDVSHIPQTRIGDEVVLIGRQKNNVIKVASFTQSTQLLNQEMMSRLPADIPRKAVR